MPAARPPAKTSSPNGKSSVIWASLTTYLDHGLTGPDRNRPGLAQALAAVRRGDALVVPKLDRLARSVTDARAIADELERCEVRLQLGTAVYDPSEPDGSHVFYSEARRGLATVAETLGSRSQRHRFSSSIG
jgi:DNA invertase Pin-like site-specific DNA recombinase